MPSGNQQTVEYCCPGQQHPISRSVHLGRLARFYPGCRQCVHREDTGSLSRRQVEQLAETRPRGLPRPLFHEEGAGGVFGNDLGPEAARDMAAALGICLQRRPADPDANLDRTPVVVIAGDGRPLSCELVAAVGEGLRWAGCHVVDIGSATAACLAFAIDHLQISGGILLGNPGDRPHTTGLKFWAPGSRPLSAGTRLDLLEQNCQTGIDRPKRSYGSLRRFRAEVPYLATLAEHYHALRPLRLVLDTSCGPLWRYLKELTKPLACRIIAGKATAEQVLAHDAHFAVRIADDGETCRLFDEQGRRVSDERLLLLLARRLTEKDRQRAVVLEDGTAPEIVRRIEDSAGRVVFSGARRAEMQRAMQLSDAVFGGGPGGRFWYTNAGSPLPDALMTLTMLLVTLSQSDRRLSEVLDRETAVV